MSEPARNQLPEKRSEKGFTQHKLSLSSGLRQSDISEYENGHTFPRPDAIAAIAGALGEAEATVYEWLRTPASPIAPEPTSDAEPVAAGASR